MNYSCEMLRFCKISWLLPTLVVALCQTPGHAGQFPRVPLAEQSAYDVTFYDLSLFVNPADSTVQGVLRADANILAPLNRFVLDLDQPLRVRRVWLQGARENSVLRFEKRDERLWINLPRRYATGERISISIEYEGRPRVSRFQNGRWSDGFLWSRSKSGEPWLGVNSRRGGGHIWWPCKDDASDEADSMALHITVPEPLTVAANGYLRDYVRHGGRLRKHTFHWFISAPIHSYGVTLNIAQYSKIEDTYQSFAGLPVPVTFWVMPENYVKAMKLFPQFRQQLSFLERTVGPYPFRADKYGVAQTVYSGTAHQTINSYGGSFENNRYGFDTLHFRELTNEWFGNLVTAPDDSDEWLQGGVASYLEALYAESLLGSDAYIDYLAGFRAAMPNRVYLAPSAAANQTESDVFNKGAWVLHSLRYLIGKDALFQILRRLAYPDPSREYASDTSRLRFLTTADFIRNVNEVSGVNLDWFFELYLRQPDLPRLEATQEGNKLSLTWRLPSGFRFPMPVEIQTSTGVKKISMTSGGNTVRLPAGALLAIDPNRWILKEETGLSVRKFN